MGYRDFDHTKIPYSIPYEPCMKVDEEYFQQSKQTIEMNNTAKIRTP